MIRRALPVALALLTLSGCSLLNAPDEIRSSDVGAGGAGGEAAASSSSATSGSAGDGSTTGSSASESSSSGGGFGGEGGAGGAGEAGGSGGQGGGGFGGEGGAGPSSSSTTGSSSSATGSSSSSTSSSSGSGGGPACDPPFTWAASAPEDSPVYELPCWLEFKSPSKAKSIQTSATTLRGNLGADAARARNMGHGWGLAVESERTSYGPNQILLAWERTGSTPVVAGSSPMGSSGGYLMANTAGEQNIIRQPVEYIPGGPVTLSLWTFALTPSAATHVGFEGDDALPSIDVTSPDAAWTWRSATGSSTAETGNVAFIDPARGMQSFAHSLRVMGVQVETARYPTSLITTVGEPVTRKAETLSTPMTSAIVADKLVDVTLTYSPLYADGEMSADHDLIYLGPTTRLYVTTKGEIILKTASGTTTLSTDTPPLWKRGSEITIHAAFGEAERSLHVIIDGNDAGPSTYIGAALPAISQIYILGNASGAQESADLRSLSIK